MQPSFAATAAISAASNVYLHHEKYGRLFKLDNIYNRLF